jgi:hypothetical protein
MVEHTVGGPVVMQSFLRPNAEATANGATTEQEAHGQQEEAPMLVGIVVGATADDGKDARRAAARMERVGRQFQKEWIAEERDGSD